VRAWPAPGRRGSMTAAVKSPRRIDSGGIRGSCGATCSGTRFAPKFVRQLRKINRNFYVQVTEPPASAEDPADRLTLYKWWPGGRTNLNINTSDQWERLKEIVDSDLAPFLKWKTRRAISRELASISRDAEQAGKQLTAIAKNDPAFLSRILKEVDFKKVPAGEHEKLGEALSEIASIYVNAGEGLRRSIHGVVRRLPSEGESAIRELTGLMESLTLHQITAVASEVQRRVGLLQTFKERALDDRTYEIRGDGSIHRLLEQAMWIVDERYWLMHSNSALRTVIGKELEKKDKKLAAKRRDFVCGTVDKKLIIIELKRPSHSLSVEDLNQLELYVVIAQEYDDRFNSVEAVLVGKKIDDTLKRVLKLRGRTFSATTFSSLIDDTERRYHDYLKHLQEQNRAA
jgi:hypothetical protein